MGLGLIHKRATITDVAAHAQVGVTTVSRMLRDPSKVSEKLRARIEAAIDALDYVPDPKAQALAAGKAQTIGVLIPSLSNIVFSDILSGIHDAVKGTPYYVQIGYTRYDEDEEDRLIALFLAQRPSALIVTGVDQSEKSRRKLAEAGIPIVQILDHTPTPVDHLIGFCHETAARLALDHLLDQGYRKIACLVARFDPRVTRRLEGYRAFLQQKGLYDPKREGLNEEASSVQKGRALLAEVLDRCPDTDAVFCANDDLALGALFECQKRGLRVPQDMGIVGFNDLEMMAATNPALTSVQTNRYEIGYQAANVALERLSGQAGQEKIQSVPAALAVRESSQRLRGLDIKGN